MVGILLLRNRDIGLTLKTGFQGSLLFFNCQNSSLDYFDTVNKFIEKKMEESITTKSLMNARKSNHPIQDIGEMKKHFDNASRWSIDKWISVLAKVEDRRKRFNIAWIRTIHIDSCAFEQCKGSQEAQSILHCKTLYCYQKVLPSIFITSKMNKN